MDEYIEVAGEVPGDHLSFSKIKTVQTCAYKFKLQYVDKVRGLVRIPLLLGKNFHLAHEYGVLEMIDRKTPKVAEVVEVGVESLKKELKKTKGIDFTEFDNSKSIAKDDLKKMIGLSFPENIKTIRPLSREAVEKSFEFQLDSEIKVQGRIDLLETGADGDGITELKTSTRKPNDLLVFDWQTSIYQSSQKSIRWMKKLLTLRHQNKNRDITVLQYYKKADSPEWIEEILTSLRQIKEMIKGFSIFGYPKTSDLTTCSWCSFRYGCRPDIFNHEGKIEGIIEKKILFSSNPKTQEATTNDNYGRNQKGQRVGDGGQRNIHHRVEGERLPSGF